MKHSTPASARRERILRAVSLTLVLSMLQQFVAPTLAYALTSGPGQPEFSSFEPVGTSDMVDLYSGDFSYNIPLLSVPGPNGGYPINLAYHSGPGVDEEASWVGLGWNVNVGAVNRQLRGLPDDFKGDQITHRSYIKPNWTTAFNLFAQRSEFFGVPASSSSPTPAVTGQIYYNSYRGLGYRIMANPLVKHPIPSLNLGLSYDSQGGIGVEADLSAAAPFGNAVNGVTVGAGYNSRQGLSEASFASSSTVGGKHIKAGGSQMSFSTQFNVPSVNLPMRTNTVPFSAYLNGINGTPVFGRFDSPASQSITGFYSESMVDNGGLVQSNGYGYLHTASSTLATDMRDFQRENIPYSKRVPNLAPSSFTYDQFMQSGQGTGSQFRSYANAIGVLSDREQTNSDYTTPLNLEFGAGTSAFVHFGVGFNLGVGSNTTGGWQSIGILNDVEYASVFNFKGKNDPEYESNPFKVTGDMTAILDSDDQLKRWGGDKPVRVELMKNSDNTYFDRQFEAKNLFLDKNQNTVVSQAGTLHKYRTQGRERRSTNVESLNEVQAQAYGITKNTGYQQVGNNLTNFTKVYYGGARANHISEMTTVQPDGMRYTYGLPAYNNRQIDGSFTTGISGNHNSKTVPVPYLVGSPWSVNNVGIYDEYSQQTEMQHYVHSWLLSSVCSPDYVDLTQDGPSDDDYGYWVRFNYTKTSSAYNWHVPYSGANYYDGKKGDPTDNRASYSCGNREQHYLSSVETKTHIAIFYTSKREDGVAAAANINGGLPSTIAPADRLYRLDSVKLYSKLEYYLDPANRLLRPFPIAIKTVHFRYTYELCGKGTSTYYNQFVTNNTGVMVAEDGTITANPSLNVNANKGKLTLKKVFFTYQKNERGEFSPYLFRYGNTTAGSSDNPYYDPTAVDRWGNYKNISGYTASGNAYPYVDHPFCDQTSTQAQNPQAPVIAPWSMKSLTLPSGAIINVQYENDDYGYVEDQPAMRMFDIVDLSEASPSGATNNDWRSSSTSVVKTAESGAELLHGSYRVYFRLEAMQAASMSTADQRSYVLDKYLNQGNLKKLYFNAMMDLKNSGNPQEIDNVRGYAELEYSDINLIGPPASILPVIGLAKSDASVSGFDLGFITLKGVPVQSATILNTSVGLPPIPKVSPFIHAALQHLHFNRSELVFQAMPYSTSVSAQVTNLLSSVTTFSAQISQMIAGFNASVYAQGFGKKMYLNGKSYIRLYEPDGVKLGGGSRVKRITVNDNWVNTSTTGADAYEYGLDYTYTISENGRTISSGVCYEPQIGAEESALRQPIEYVNSGLLRSDEKLFLEKPLMESYYPGAVVGYRKVTVKSIAPEKADLGDDNTANASNVLKYNAAPISIYEFFTPKEFPVKFDQTEMSADPSIVRAVVIPGIYTGFAKRKARSQGYSVVLNDMSGKMRSVEQRTRPTTTNPSGTLITRQEYIYNTEKPLSDLYPNYLSSKVQVLTGDGTYQTASIGQSHDILIDMKEDRMKSVSGGLEANLDVNGTILVPTFFPQASVRDLSMRTVVVNKIIYRTGILRAVIATHESSTIRTDNVAFDPETGDALITKTTNEFKDPIFSFSYPGHWYYDALKGGYLNHNVFVDRTDAFGNTLPALSAVAQGRVAIPAAYLATGKNARDYFSVGDEVYLELSSGSGRYHVMKVDAGFIDLVTFSGAYIPNSTSINSIRVIRSSHDNLQTIAAGSLAMRTLNGIQQFDPQTGTPVTSNATYTIPTAQNILSASAVEFTDIMQLFCVSGCDVGNVGSGSTVDPYANGLRGNWRPYRSYAFVTDRTQADNIRQDGTYTAFVPYTWLNPMTADSRWTSAATITKYSPYGFELENKDATGNYTAALYGYRQTLNTAVAANAQYKEIAFDGFEDYTAVSNCDMANNHWGFTSNTLLSSVYAHTGKVSLKVANGQAVQVTNAIGVDNCEQQREQDRLPQTGNPNDPTAQYVLDDCDCVGKFKPTAGKKYMLSMWVKQTAVGASGYVPNTLTQFTSPGVAISTNAGSPVVTAEPASPVIEGWQRMLYSFTIPVGATSLIISFTNNAGTVSDDYFDDIRIQPYDANMTTYVYDPVTYRLVAQLDANNFATFYIYNEQGMLEKTRVETVDGIKTVKEGRSNTDKH